MSTVADLAAAICRTVYTGPSGTPALVRRQWVWKPWELAEMGSSRCITVLPVPDETDRTIEAREQVLTTAAFYVFLQQRSPIDNVDRGDEWIDYVEQVVDRFLAGRLVDLEPAELQECAIVLLCDQEEARQVGAFTSVIKVTYRIAEARPLP